MEFAAQQLTRSLLVSGPMSSQCTGSNLLASENPSDFIEKLLFPRQNICRTAPKIDFPEQCSEEGTGEDFAYSVLDSRDAIRLIILHPGTRGGEINCSMLTTALKDAPEYEAISYVWGSSIKNCIISCDEKRIHVSPNLYAALQDLRDASQKRTLWADAICINQQDLAETSSQVRIMRSIFGRAVRVLTWLGPEDSEDKTALKLIKKLAAVCHECGYRDPKDLLDMKKFQDVAKAIDPSFFDSCTWRDWRAFFRFYEHLYFCRTWVIQEVQATQNCIVICSGQAVPFYYIQLAALWALRAPPHVQRAMFTDRGLSNAIYMRTLATSGSSLLQRLEQTRGFLATDPRDKIFAFLRPEDRIALNYKNPIWKVFIEAATQILQEDGLDCLSYVFHNHESLQLTASSFPTWIPTFSNSYFMPLCKLDQLKAGGDRSLQTFSVRHGKLATMAMRLGRVKKVFPKLSWGGLSYRFSGKETFEYPGLPIAMDWIWKQFVFDEEKCEHRYPTGCSITEAFSLTLTAGLREPACLKYPATHYSAFSTFTKRLFKCASSTFKARRRIGDTFYGSPHTSWMCECYQEETHDVNIQGGALASENPENKPNPLQPSGKEGKSATTDDEYFQRAAQSACNNRCLFVMDSGYLGLGPRGLGKGAPCTWIEEKGVYPEMTSDDFEEVYEVWIIAGAKTPFVLQPNGKFFLVLGECYVHGFMDGEAVQERNGEGKWQDVLLS